MKRSYNNPWIPQKALAILSAHKGTLLDVGGGAAPYYRATHVVDALPFSAERLAANAWGREPGGPPPLRYGVASRRQETFCR